MENHDSPLTVITVFAHYGFRKASMADLAEAVGVSRQTLYNRFKTKDAVFDWAVDSYARQKREAAIAELQDANVSVETCLLNAYSRWGGDSMVLLHSSPHGMEILDLGFASIKRANTDHIAVFEVALANFLVNRGICKDHGRAADVTFVLTVASKGVMLKSETVQEYQNDMARIIRAMTA